MRICSTQNVYSNAVTKYTGPVNKYVIKPCQDSNKGLLLETKENAINYSDVIAAVYYKLINKFLYLLLLQDY